MRLHRQRAIDVGSGGKSDMAVTTANLDTFATANTTDALNVEHFDSINESLLLGNILHLAGNSALFLYLQRSFMRHRTHYLFLFISSFPFWIISRDFRMLESQEHFATSCFTFVNIRL